MSDKELDAITLYYKNNASRLREVIEKVVALNSRGKTKEIADVCEEALQLEVDPIEY
jgi:hypothetical protein